jgi:hypothetical protein
LVSFLSSRCCAGGEGLLLLNLLYAGEGSALGELATFISRVEGACLCSCSISRCIPWRLPVLLQGFICALSPVWRW